MSAALGFTEVAFRFANPVWMRLSVVKEGV